MLDNSYIDQFSPHLFWDVRREDVDMDKSSQYVIKRILEYGLFSDWNLLRSYYGLDRIVKTAKDFRELEPRALAFLSVLSKTPKQEFRCYTYQQSIPQHWNF